MRREDDFYGDAPATQRVRDNWPLERVPAPVGAVYVAGKGWMRPCPCSSETRPGVFWVCPHDEHHRVPL